MNDLAEIERLRAENKKHKLLWQEAEKRVFGADMWVRGVTEELETLRANALTAEEAQQFLDCWLTPITVSHPALQKLQRIAAQHQKAKP